MTLALSDANVVVSGASAVPDVVLISGDLRLREAVGATGRALTPAEYVAGG